MKPLAETGDNHALALRFLDRFIFLVEGPGDLAGFRRIAGPGMLADFEFKLPLEKEGGCTAVHKRVRQERDENGNTKVFGLLDGEAAAGLGAVGELLRCDEPMFETSRADHAGLIFLSGHEFENLFFAYGDVCDVLAAHCRLSRSDDGSEHLSDRLEDLTRRFFGAAMFKYTALDAAVGTCGAKILNTWFFGSERTTTDILRKARSEVLRLKGDWPTFLKQLFVVTRTLRQHVAGLPKDPTKRRERMLRLADGKALLSHLRSVVGAGQEVEGHLIRELLKTSYPEIFQAELRRRTAPKVRPFEQRASRPRRVLRSLQ